MERNKSKKAAKKAAVKRKPAAAGRSAKKAAVVLKHQSRLAKKHAKKAAASASPGGLPEQIKTWLVAHPLINWQGLCRDAGIPFDVIKLAVHGRTMKGVYKQMPIPDKHCAPLVSILREYGFKATKR